MKICLLDEFRKREYLSTNGKVANWHKVSGGAGLCSHDRLPSSPHKHLFTKDISLLGL